MLPTPLHGQHKEINNSVETRVEHDGADQGDEVASSAAIALNAARVPLHPDRRGGETQGTAQVRVTRTYE